MKQQWFYPPSRGFFGLFIFFSFLLVPSSSLAAGTVPNTTTTWYVGYAGDSDQEVQKWAYSKGFELGSTVQALPGVQDNVVILTFGAPTYVNGQYGATAWIPKGGITVEQIQWIAQNYADGYFNGTGSDTDSQLKLAIGTSNSGAGVTAQHAQAWAKMIRKLGEWSSNINIGHQVEFRGANDMEIGFNSPGVTRAWVDAYKAELQGTDYFLYNFGDAQGCPQQGSSEVNRPCDKGWTQEDVHYVSRGANFTYAIPEIYSTAGGNSRQWQQLSLYGHLNHGQIIPFKGPLTQMSACSQRGCLGTDNSPVQGWNQLWDRVHEDDRTAHPLTWSTDIRWRK